MILENGARATRRQWDFGPMPVRCSMLGNALFSISWPLGSRDGARLAGGAAACRCAETAVAGAEAGTGPLLVRQGLPAERVDRAGFPVRSGRRADPAY